MFEFRAGDGKFRCPVYWAGDQCYFAPARPIPPFTTRRYKLYYQAMAQLDTNSAPDHHTSVVAGALWMVVISLALFFVPAVNGVIAGLVGGYLVGTLGRAMAAAILPALIVALGLWALLTVVGLPVIGFFAGAAVTVLIAVSEIGLFLGAVLGVAAHQLTHHV